MIRVGLWALACACAAACPLSAQAPADADLKNTLAIQTAMEQGRYHLLQADPARAVQVLEAQLPRINGNRQYLMLLRDAYRAYIRDLHLAKQGAQAKKYVERLAILDPAAAADPALRPPAAPPPAPPVASAAAQPTPPRAPVVARAKVEDDPFDLANKRKPADDRRQVARSLLERAQDEFGKKRYREALAFFEQAHQADQSVAVAGLEPWAYCKLNRVVETLNRKDGAPPAWSELDREVRAALQMAPRLSETAEWLLREIRERQGDLAVVVKHGQRTAQGWEVAETTSFRIFHKQTRECAEKVARVAERTRRDMQQKWFGAAEDWAQKCDVYLHATGQDYSRETGAPTSSPGHSRIETERNSGRVVSRRLELHCDVPTLLDAVLPHETTHAVLAGRFGSQQVPRWADEGMAVLSEPGERVELHRRNLARCSQEGRLFSLRELMTLADYPAPQRIGAFYAQSVVLVDFLTRLRGPVVFASFLRDGLREGYEPALRRHYNFRDFNDLQERWNGQALAAVLRGAPQVAGG
jgi:tetratricopeptide (TPR) repeat protein